MAPMASTLIAASPAPFVLWGNCFPEDILVEIGSYLSPCCLNSLLRTCKRFYGIVVPSLYRVVYLHVRPMGYEVDDDYPFAMRLMACLLSTLHHNTPDLHSPRFLPQFVRKISYKCDSLEANLRGLPMLAILLRSTPYVRDIQLDIDQASVPLGLDLLNRRGVIRSPPSTGIAIFEMPSAVALTLPCLKSVRSTRPQILAALLQWRPVQTAALDWAASFEDLAVVFPFTLATTPNHLARLSLSFVAEEIHFDSILRAVAMTFPRLDHLAVRCATRAAPTLLATWIEYLALEPMSLVQLRALSINHGIPRGLTPK
ncbi:hypothetical protein C2E23DRAFT_885298 [Lenzites betulinus]|nr:hypothetical protein C2E23DRAFT_885298 [Lenzites betulinus]